MFSRTIRMRSSSSARETKLLVLITFSRSGFDLSGGPQPKSKNCAQSAKSPVALRRPISLGNDNIDASADKDNGHCRLNDQHRGPERGSRPEVVELVGVVIRFPPDS